MNRIHWNWENKVRTSLPHGRKVTTWNAMQWYYRMTTWGKSMQTIPHASYRPPCGPPHGWRLHTLGDLLIQPIRWKIICQRIHLISNFLVWSPCRALTFSLVQTGLGRNAVQEIPPNLGSWSGTEPNQDLYVLSINVGCVFAQCSHSCYLIKKGSSSERAF